MLKYKNLQTLLKETPHAAQNICPVNGVANYGECVCRPATGTSSFLIATRCSRRVQLILLGYICLTRTHQSIYVECLVSGEVDPPLPFISTPYDREPLLIKWRVTLTDLASILLCTGNLLLSINC